jgi:hypothetical protein
MQIPFKKKLAERRERRVGRHLLTIAQSFGTADRHFTSVKQFEHYCTAKIARAGILEDTQREWMDGLFLDIRTGDRAGDHRSQAVRARAYTRGNC